MQIDILSGDYTKYIPRYSHSHLATRMLKSVSREDSDAICSLGELGCKKVANKISRKSLTSIFYQRICIRGSPLNGSRWWTCSNVAGRSSILALEFLHMARDQFALDKGRNRAVLHILHREFALALSFLPDRGTIAEHAV